MDKRIMHIFYKDLNFHSALLDAAAEQSVLPVFLWSEYLNQDVDTTPSLLYRWQWATMFNQKLLPSNVNMPVVETVDNIIALCQSFAITQVSMLRHFEPREVEFQEKLAFELKARGLKLKLFDLYRLYDLAVVDADYKPLAFADYYLNWQKLKPKKEVLAEIAWIAVDLGNHYRSFDRKVDLQADFIAYQELLAGNAQPEVIIAISAMLNHGLLNPATVYHQINALKDSPLKEQLLYYLAYRDYSYTLLATFPDLAVSDYRQNQSQWLNAAFDYQLWCKGETGKADLDAAMHRLYQEGKISMEMRRAVSEYLINDLKIIWQEGALWFKEHLNDYDLAINSIAWQALAGTGIEAEPLANH